MFYGEKLTQLRELHGFSRRDLAHKLDVSEQAIGQYENYQAIPRIDILNKLIQIFEVKSSFFTSPSFIKNDSISVNAIAYRTKERSSLKKIRNEIVYVTYAKYFTDYFESLVTSNIGGFNSLRQQINTSNIEEAAQIARKFFHLQNNKYLMSNLEQSGITILERELNTSIDAYSGFTIDEKPYIILGNVKKTAVRRNFDLAHELGHLLLHSNIDMTDLSDHDHTLIEQEANNFAAAFLLPKAEFIKDFSNISKKTNPDFYLELKKKYLVSLGALEYRAYKLKLITYQGNRYFWALMNKKGYRKFEPLDSQLIPIKPSKIKNLLSFLLDNNVISLRKFLEQFGINTKFLINLFDLKPNFFDLYLPHSHSSNIINLDLAKKRFS